MSVVGSMGSPDVSTARKQEDVRGVTCNTLVWSRTEAWCAKTISTLTHDNGSGKGFQLLQKRIAHRALDIDAGRGRAVLAAVDDARHKGPTRRSVQICVFKHDKWRLRVKQELVADLAAELKGHTLDQRARKLRDTLPCCGAARERHHANVRMRAERLADLR